MEGLGLAAGPRLDGACLRWREAEKSSRIGFVVMVMGSSVRIGFAAAMGIEAMTMRLRTGGVVAMTFEGCVFVDA